jgi:RNA polymerase sigma-70 factor (ECF subfamily)
MDPKILLEACKKGDRKAQMEIYKSYYKAMYNVSLRIIKNTAEAEDVMQESFLSAFQKLDTFKGEVTFGAWLKRIVINKSLDLIKNKKAIISLDTVADIPDEQNDDNYISYNDLSMQLVNKALSDLPEGYRLVLTLYLIEGYDHEEISQILNISNATFRTQYHRARKQLATRITNLKAVS